MRSIGGAGIIELGDAGIASMPGFVRLWFSNLGPWTNKHVNLLAPFSVIAEWLMNHPSRLKSTAGRGIGPNAAQTPRGQTAVNE